MSCNAEPRAELSSSTKLPVLFPQYFLDTPSKCHFPKPWTLRLRFSCPHTIHQHRSCTISYEPSYKTMSTFMNQTLRSSTFRASASIPSAITQSLAYPRRFTTRQNAAIKSAFEARIKAVNAKPNLTQSEKYRTSKFLFSMMDSLAAKIELTVHRSRTRAILRLPKQSQFDGKGAPALREALSLHRKVRSLTWETFQLSMLTPLSEVGLATRMRIPFEVVCHGALLTPLLRCAIFFSSVTEARGKKHRRR